MLLCGSFCVCFSRSGPRVRGQHPAFPVPSWQEGEEMEQSSGELRRENAKARLLPHTLCHRPAVTGRSSIPEAAVIEPRRRGVLDSPPSLGMTVVLGDLQCSLILRHCERSDLFAEASARAGVRVASSQELFAMTMARQLAPHSLVVSAPGLTPGSPRARDRGVPRSSGGRGCARNSCRATRSPRARPVRDTAGT